jgi:UDP-3-O-[3-hydroxymyristoyl] glucosamine N-acyltransferase
MSDGPSNAVFTDTNAPHVATSAIVVGAARMGEGSLLAQGAVVRSQAMSVEIGGGSAVLENCVVIGSARLSTRIGRRSVFGHRCTVIGATVGDLCEIGNASVLMPGARLGDRVSSGRARSSRPAWHCPTQSSPSDGRRASYAPRRRMTCDDSQRSAAATCHCRRRRRRQ